MSKHLTENYLKSANCKIVVKELIVDEDEFGNKGAILEHLFDIETKIDFSTSSPITAYGEWAIQISTAVINELSMFPHLFGEIDFWKNEIGVDDDSKACVWIKMWMKDRHYLRLYRIIVATYGFSNRQFVGDEKNLL